MEVMIWDQEISIKSIPLMSMIEYKYCTVCHQKEVQEINLATKEIVYIVITLPVIW